MRKLCYAICGILLASGTLAQAGVAGIEKSIEKDAKAIWLVDDFEDGNLDGWAAPTGACTMSNDTIGANGTTRSIKIIGACGHFGGSRLDMDGMAVTGLSYWVRSGDIGANDAYLLLDDADSSDFSYIMLLALNGYG